LRESCADPKSWSNKREAQNTGPREKPVGLAIS
jgi:hypothetical protein